MGNKEVFTRLTKRVFKTVQGICYVTSLQGFNVLGSDFLEEFGLFDIPINTFCKQVTASAEVTDINELVGKFATLFQEGLGRCSKTQVQLFLVDGAIPVFKPRRPVAYHSQRLLEKKLLRLQHLGVIEPVEFSDWAAPIVVVRKSQIDADGDPVVRIYADYSTGFN